MSNSEPRLAPVPARLKQGETDEGAASVKPHGRLAWTLPFKAFGDPRFVDLSVMPRALPSPHKSNEVSHDRT